MLKQNINEEKNYLFIFAFFKLNSYFCHQVTINELQLWQILLSEVRL